MLQERQTDCYSHWRWSGPLSHHLVCHFVENWRTERRSRGDHDDTGVNCDDTAGDDASTDDGTCSDNRQHDVGDDDRAQFWAVKMKVVVALVIVLALVTADDVEKETQETEDELSEGIYVEAPPGMDANEVARALEHVLAAGASDPIQALKEHFERKKSGASAVVRAPPPPPQGEYRLFPCQSKSSVSLARFLAVGHDGFWARPLPPLTPAYSLSYSVLMLPGVSWRMLHVFGSSHALYCNSTHFKLVCSSAARGEQELMYAVASRQSLVGRWVGITAVVDAEHLVMIVDALEEVTFECGPRFPFAGLYVGATVAPGDDAATRGLFANVRYHNYNVHGEETLVEPVALELPASLDMMRDMTSSEEEEEELALLELICECDDPNATRTKLEERAGRGDPSAMSAMGVFECLGHECSVNRSLAWHLLAVAADKTADGTFVSCAALAHSVGQLGFPVRLHFMRLAAQAAFEELSQDGFRVVDYVPIEEAGLEELHAGEEAKNDEVLESLRYSAEGGDLESTLRVSFHFSLSLFFFCNS